MIRRLFKRLYSSSALQWMGCGACMIACGGAPDPKRAPERVQSAIVSMRRADWATAAVPDSEYPHAFPIMAGEEDPAIPDSVLRKIAALEDSLGRDSPLPRAPALLWALGNLMQRSLGNLHNSGHARQYAMSHRTLYAYSEPDASFVYNGFHFTELVRRFPHDSLAAHAAYEISNLGMVGECEGEVDCYIARELLPLRGFMEAYPKSPLVREAIRRVNEAFEKTLTYAPKPQDAWGVDTAAVRIEIAQYDSTVAKLPPDLRALALPTIERWRSKLGRAPVPPI